MGCNAGEGELSAMGSKGSRKNFTLKLAFTIFFENMCEFHKIPVWRLFLHIFDTTIQRNGKETTYNWVHDFNLNLEEKNSTSFKKEMRS